MRFQVPLSFPNRADRTVLPAALASLLALAFGLQLIWTSSEPDLPPVLAVGAARSNAAPPKIVPTATSPIVLERPLFAPRQSVSVANGALPSILGGAMVAGTVSIRGRTFAVIRRPNGTASNLSVGGSVAGWRLVSLGQQAAVFVKGAERREIAYGYQPTQASEEPSGQ